MKKKKYIECSMQYCGKKLVVRWDKEGLVRDYEMKVIHYKILKQKEVSLKSLLKQTMLSKMQDLIIEDEPMQLIHFG
jgi:hypothetical protein